MSEWRARCGLRVHDLRRYSLFNVPILSSTCPNVRICLLRRLSYLRHALRYVREATYEFCVVKSKKFLGSVENCFE